ncbi:MAG: lysine-sensitive aspartokinase 3 [Melioribacteraceae bacterium]|nr:lysine-sensitive aspartokinase 3 [Melioribacteraceae bacterium]
MNQLAVAKFGGTSMSNMKTMSTCADIVLSRPEVKIVVVSATSGTTNLLIRISQSALNNDWETTDELIQSLIGNHNKIHENIGYKKSVNEKLISVFEEIRTLAKGMYYLKEISPKAYDSLLGTGEILSSILFSEVLNQISEKKNVKVFDARDVMITNNKFGSAEPDISSIKAKADELLLPIIEENIVVTQGFVGRTKKGENTVLGRGGSDYSATLLAEAVEASEVQIWTDVSGVASSDPRFVENARWINEISYSEAAELANSGAKVLHPQTLIPAIRNAIPVFVGNSFNPTDSGTWIKGDADKKPLIRAIALKRNQMILTISSIKMIDAYGFLENIFRVFSSHKLSIDLITTSEASISVTIDEPELLTDEAIEDLEKYADVTVENSLSLVTIVGNGILTTPGIAAKTFSSINGNNIRMICYGASRHNFGFLVDDKDGETIVKKLHKVFLEAE